MVFCNHKEFKGTKKCPRCYPNHVVGEESSNDVFPDRLVSSSIHKFKKNKKVK